MAVCAVITTNVYSRLASKYTVNHEKGILLRKNYLSACSTILYLYMNIELC